jgi:hypothetical protein
MKEFTIMVREVWIQPVKVKADTLREAIHKVENGEGEQVESGFEFSHSLEPEFWTAEDSEGRSYNDLTEPEKQETR